MGLSSLPSPSEGVLCAIFVNTVLSISTFKGIVRTILHIVGIHLSHLSLLPSSSSSSASPSPSQNSPTEPFEFLISSPSSPTECLIEFRSRTRALRFNSVSSCEETDHDCCVCLTEFQPESEVNRLSCGHLFHKVCLEKWVDYWNLTCPLCRTSLIPEEEDPWSIVANEDYDWSLVSNEY